jgi:hypothetical protein
LNKPRAKFAFVFFRLDTWEGAEGHCSQKKWNSRFARMVLGIVGAGGVGAALDAALNLLY